MKKKSNRTNCLAGRKTWMTGLGKTRKCKYTRMQRKKSGEEGIGKKKHGKYVKREVEEKEIKMWMEIKVEQTEY